MVSGLGFGFGACPLCSPGWSIDVQFDFDLPDDEMAAMVGHAYRPCKYHSADPDHAVDFHGRHWRWSEDRWVPSTAAP